MPTPLRYAPDPAALARELEIRDADVLDVIDARGGTAYPVSVDIGLANRFPFAGAGQRQRAVNRALSSGSIVRTATGLLGRASRHV